jgi:NAD(P)-dependent dehydrogenase (short-subunit alcohol dehydrogenase family)
MTDIRTLRVDLSNLTDVSAAANLLLSITNNKIDILLNVAGIHEGVGQDLWGAGSGVSASDRFPSGFDRVFTVNYLSHFLLTENLAKAMQHNDRPRPVVVQMSSMCHWVVDGSNLVPHNENDPPVAALPSGEGPGISVMRTQRAYSNSKLAQILIARAFQRRSGIRTVSVCPGWVATNIGDGMPFPFAWLMSKCGYAPDGWGISSALQAIFGEEEGDYVTNSRAVGIFPFLLRRPCCLCPGAIRELWVSAVIALLLILQRMLGVYTGPSPSSLESHNETIQDALYEWSLSAVEEYLR